MRSVSTTSLRVPSPRGSPASRPAAADVLVELDVERSSPWMPSDCQLSPALELQRQHAHADQVAAVDALEAARDHRLDAEQLRALGGPVADEPVPYSSPPKITVGVPSAMYFIAAS
jgi:hypothetical protein